MRTLSQKRPEIIGAIRRRSDDHQPFSLVLGFRNCENRLDSIVRSLKCEFPAKSTLLSKVSGHKQRNIYRRDEPAKTLTAYPEARSVHTSTVATLDIWEDPYLARQCRYIEAITPLMVVVSNWGYGTHATLHVTTCTEFVLPGNQRDYVCSLKPSVLKSLRDRFLHSHQRHAHNGYVMLTQQGDKHGA